MGFSIFRREKLLKLLPFYLKPFSNISYIHDLQVVGILSFKVIMFLL